MDEDAGLTAGEGSSTPLHWAVDSNSVSIVRRLIEYDCDVNAIDETSSVSSSKFRDQFYRRNSFKGLQTSLSAMSKRTQ